MKQLFFLGLFIICTSVNGQNVIFVESTEPLMRYFDQLKFTELSLKKGVLLDKIDWVNGKKKEDAQFKLLSDKFLKNLPESFYSINVGVPFIETGKPKSTDGSNFIRCTYAYVDGKVKMYLQVTIFFQVDKFDGPKVDAINLKDPSEIKDIDEKKLLKEFRKWEKAEEKNSPPPPPQPIQN
jgi:hypothetical protein